MNSELYSQLIEERKVLLDKKFRGAMSATEKKRLEQVREMLDQLEAGEDNLAIHMTVRQAFAMAAMQGLCASMGGHDVSEFSELASDSVLAADALLSALKGE